MTNSYYTLTATDLNTGRRVELFRDADKACVEFEEQDVKDHLHYLPKYEREYSGLLVTKAKGDINTPSILTHV
jgi:hypothetical protein